MSEPRLLEEAGLTWVDLVVKRSLVVKSLVVKIAEIALDNNLIVLYIMV